jgi:hypothetical protein
MYGLRKECGLLYDSSTSTRYWRTITGTVHTRTCTNHELRKYPDFMPQIITPHRRPTFGLAYVQTVRAIDLAVPILATVPADLEFLQEKLQVRDNWRRSNWTKWTKWSK